MKKTIKFTEAKEYKLAQKVVKYTEKLAKENKMVFDLTILFCDEKKALLQGITRNKK